MNKNRITNSIIVGLATLVATATWSGLENILSGTGSWLWLGIGFLVMLVFLSLNWLLTKSKPILLITLVFILISFLFAFEFHFEYLGILLVALVLLVFGSWRSIYEKENRIKIETIKILKRGLPFVVAGLSLVIASAYYFSPLSEIGQERIEIPHSIFDKAIGPVVEVVEGFVPLGLEFGEIQETLYQTINGEINKRSEPYKEFLPISLSIGIFFALGVIGIPFIWLVVLLTVFIFKILIWSKAVHIQEKSVFKEVIEL